MRAHGPSSRTFIRAQLFHPLRRRLNARHAGAAPDSAVAELGRFSRMSISERIVECYFRIRRGCSSLTGGATLDLWWAVPGVLVGMPMPLLHPKRRGSVGSSLDAFPDDLPLLAQAGIGAVVSLLNVPSDAAVYSSAGFGYHLMPISDGAAPSVEQFVAFLRFFREQRALGRIIAVHCAAGLGRTGTVLAGYLIATGSSVEAAVSRIRTARRGAIETSQQVQFLYDLAHALPSIE